MRFYLFMILIGSVFISAALTAQVVSSPNTQTYSLRGASIVFDKKEELPVKIAAQLFQEDIQRVTGKLPEMNRDNAPVLVIAGTIENSTYLDQLERSGKADFSALKGKWEAYVIQTVKTPWKDVKEALVIAGSDKRGVAYGLMDLSRQMGVSPWYWWADVPVEKRTEIWVDRSLTLNESPGVQYRGIFLNDEAPALSGWAHEKFGGFNHKFYRHVFELMLRLKSNYIWPAMWGNAFYDDDPANILTADSFGIVTGTSHHEPLMRAHDEWRRYGNNGAWNYETNKKALREFWTLGLERAWNEKIVSIGMRGDGDEPMTEETATALLEHIVADQRRIIRNVTGKPAHQTPQLWALYKEVQDYYDKGMRVPDDVTLLLCDDNWGNIRRLPDPAEPPRKGGYGIYYHFDYVGGPRNYKWINTNPLPRIWEQMHLAWQHQVKKIWIVNVGDLKPMELPISFFLDYAWNPEKITEKHIQSYTNNWAGEQFPKQFAERTGRLLAAYAKFNSRRKPELLDGNTYAFSYNEWKRVTAEYEKLYHQAKAIDRQLPPQYRDAFFQLVLHPIQASSNLYNLYYYAAKNHVASRHKSGRTNYYAAMARNYYAQDSLITMDYHTRQNGKWNHMMSQTHIGYTYWQQPEVQVMPQLFELQEGEELDIGIEGKEEWFEPPARKAGQKKFTEMDGVVSMHAGRFAGKVDIDSVGFRVIPDLGRTGSAITSFPVTARVKNPENAPHVVFEFENKTEAPFEAIFYFSPTLNFYNEPEGLRFAVGVDNKPLQIRSMQNDADTKRWEDWVAENIIRVPVKMEALNAGSHRLKYAMISNGVVLQKIVLDFGGMKKSYLGPPETFKTMEK